MLLLLLKHAHSEINVICSGGNAEKAGFMVYEREFYELIKKMKKKVGGEVRCSLGECARRF